MATFLVEQATLPRVFWDENRPATSTAFAGVQLQSAVNLLEDRTYGSLDRETRLRTVLTEEYAFLSGLATPSRPCAYDLRIVADPQQDPPVDVAILVRTWKRDGEQGDDTLQAGVVELAERVARSLPRHVTGRVMEEMSDVLRFLRPFPPGSDVYCKALTKAELIAAPKRPDAKVAFYFSVQPFNWAESDWNQLYTVLAGCSSRTVVSVGLMPTTLPAALLDHFQHLATFYARLAQPDTVKSGLYYGEQTIPPDAFAVDAERVFADAKRRYASTVFITRIQVAVDRGTPDHLVELLGTLISPARGGPTSHLEADRVGASFDVRAPRSNEEAQLLRWNLEHLDFIVPPGRPEIWERPDPPPPVLRALSSVADAREANCAFRLPAAVDGTVPGFRVRRGAFGHDERVAIEGPSIQLGTLRSGQPIEVGVNALTKHTLAVGTTGSGKTTTVLKLLRSLWVDHGVPFLVLEPVNSDADDYRRLLTDEAMSELEVVTVGDEATRPLRFNPFEVPKGVLVGEHATNLLECFKAAFGLWEPLPSIYQEALNLTYLNRKLLTSEVSTGAQRWPTVVDFIKGMSRATADLGYVGETKANIEAASIRRARQLATGPTASTFLTDQPNQIEALMERPVILELKSLGSGDQQALMIALLLNAITECYKASRGLSGRLVHVTVIEEAHRLLARPEPGRAQQEAQAKEKAAEAFANTLAENRKYGEGIVIVEQLPTKLVADAVKNTNLKLVHRLTAEDDRRYVGDTMGLDEAQQRFATRLQTGEALVYSDELPEAMQISITPASLGVDPPAIEPLAVPPFAPCKYCRAKCRYRGAAVAIIQDPRFMEQTRLQVRRIGQRDLSEEEKDVRWKALIGSLVDLVKDIPALPDTEPGVADAAFCVFLHSLAARTMKYSSSWPREVATRLGIRRSRSAIK